VGISASGSSRETLAAMDRYRGTARTVAITERIDSDLADACEITIPLMAGQEAGGVACRSFQHSGLVLRLLEARLARGHLDFAGLCRRVAEGTSELLERRPQWLPQVTAALDTSGMVGVIAPAERWSCAAQSALMFREGPRRPAVGSETGDWSHIDVYLTKTSDYRALLLTGSRYDDDAIEWLRRRGSTIVTLGRAPDAIHLGLRHAHSGDPTVAVHVDTLVAELVAARIWRGQSH
jgi:glucosamine--fructose-6-phosphate aminotransferase (isomerizing)